MTEIAIHQPTTGTVERYPSLTERIEYAKALSAGGLLPDSYRERPANVLIAMEYAAALDIAPIVAMQQISVINGRPSLGTALMMSLTRRAGHRITLTGDMESATCSITRGDDGETTTETFTKDDAVRSSLWGKGHWAKNPALMLKYRAASQAIRLACSEVLAGMTLSTEEVVDMGDDEPRTDDTPKAAKSVDRLRATLTRRHDNTHTTEDTTDTTDSNDVVDAEEIHDDDTMTATPEAEQAWAETDTRTITDAQRRALFAAFRDAGYTSDARSDEGRAERLDYIGHTIGRPVQSTNELRFDEAATVIDSLRGQ